MEKRFQAVQLARVPVLMLLLWTTGWTAQAKVEARAEVSMADYWGPWAVSLLLSLVFVVLALLGRLRWHSWLVLAIEAVVAGVVAIVPPLSWVLWLGVGGSWVTAMTGGLAQPLGLTWLTVVGFCAVRQMRTSLTGRQHHHTGTAPPHTSDAT